MGGYGGEYPGMGYKHGPKPEGWKRDLPEDKYYPLKGANPNEEEEIFNYLKSLVAGGSLPVKNGEEKGLVIWTGNLTRSKQHSVNVELVLVEGKHVEIRENSLNITHREIFEVALKKKALSVCVMQPSAMIFKDKFEDYIKYLNSKHRAGVIFTQDYRINLLPKSEVTEKICSIRAGDLLALVGPKGDELPEFIE
jgi:hypothetical protein